MQSLPEKTAGQWRTSSEWTEHDKGVWELASWNSGSQFWFHELKSIGRFLYLEGGEILPETNFRPLALDFEPHQMPLSRIAKF